MLDIRTGSFEAPGRRDTPFFSAGHLTASERPFLRKYLVKADLSDPPTRDIINATFGIGAFPTPNSVVDWSGCAIIWLGPDELLIVHDRDVAPVEDMYSQATKHKMPCLVLDVSDQRTIFRLQGAGAKNVLSRGTSIDLRVDRLLIGECRQTLLAGVVVIIHRFEELGYDLYVDQTYRDYLSKWITTTVEYALFSPSARDR
ncbi:sarcosine oxidase subunit gamma [Mesorhizobium captivum]|uniref:sarcosine oxidase subunit gamma n=1 Tax=Mesorhizobium captivum TaxID=3072319 RepID=UPI003D323BEF